MSTRKKILMGCLFLLVSCVSVFSVYMYVVQQPSQTEMKALRSAEDFREFLYTNKEDLSSVQSQLSVYIEDIGITDVVTEVVSGLQNDWYGINDCHRTMHVIGHFAYNPDVRDFAALVDEDIFSCGYAYVHGIEAQISLSSPDPITDLHSFCAELLKVNSESDCYHGVGHEQMSTKLDVAEALRACDLVGPGSPTSNLNNCYQGVFSEYVFQLAGVDGDTGIPFPGGPEIEPDFINPLDYCVSLDERYQESCSLQLSRRLVETHPINEAIVSCLEDRFPLDLRANCVSIVSAVYAQDELKNSDTMHANSVVLETPEALVRQAHIRGTAGEFFALSNSGVSKNFSDFCSSFKEANDVAFCEEQFSHYRIQNER